MTGHLEGLTYHISKSRLETLIDGIFAIAMTLLVLGITPPKPLESLAPVVLPGMMLDLLPQIFLFIVAFLILAMFWLGHHRQFHFVHRVDTPLVWINVLLLISIVFVPFSTDVAGDYPDVLTAVLIFHANMFIIGLLFAIQWRHICRHEHLCEPVPEKAIIRDWFFRSALIPAVAFAAGAVAFYDPGISLLVYLALPAGAGMLRHIPSP
jgi:uncharacterized membrane protein